MYMHYADVPALPLDKWLEECRKVDLRQILEPWVEPELIKEPDIIPLNLRGCNRLLRMKVRNENAQPELKTFLDFDMVDTLGVLSCQASLHRVRPLYLRLKANHKNIGFTKKIIKTLEEKYDLGGCY